jgi:serine/threonine protein kinase
MREVAILAPLDHPYVLQLLAVRPPMADDPALLIATEWIRPGALKFDRGQSPTDAAKIVVGIALGMAYLHSQGVLHRDLKPANVLVDQAMRPRICDFGHSKVCRWNATQTDDQGICFERIQPATQSPLSIIKWFIQNRSLACRPFLYTGHHRS